MSDQTTYTLGRVVAPSPGVLPGTPGSTNQIGEGYVHAPTLQSTKTLAEMGLPERGPLMVDMPRTRVVRAKDIVERCAQELELMGRGHVAHEHDVLLRAAKRLRDEARSIIRSASE